MIKELEELQRKLLGFKQCNRDYCMENLEESTEFRRGFSAGEDRAYSAISDMLGIIIKYGDN